VVNKGKLKRYQRKWLIFINVVIITIYVCCVITLSFFWRKSQPPSIIFYSLSHEQASKLFEVEATLREPRFSFRIPKGNIIFNYPSWRRILVMSKKVVLDVPTHILISNIARKDLNTIILDYFRNVTSHHHSILSNLKILKRESFDKLVFQVFERNCQGKLSLVCTNSFLYRLPAIFEASRHSQKIMMWYSINNRPFSRQSETNSVTWNYAHIKRFIDCHFVWNAKAKNFLDELGFSEVFVSGAILFQEKRIKNKNPSKFIITFFDVTPNRARSVKQDAFYSEENTMRALLDFVRIASDACNKDKEFCQVRIKSKRKYNSFHSDYYIRTLESTCTANNIEVLEPESNLYEIVSESDIVIGVPFTSPVVLGTELNSFAVFFASGFEGWEISSDTVSEPVIYTSEELHSLLIERIQEKKKGAFN